MYSLHIHGDGRENMEMYKTSKQFYMLYRDSESLRTLSGIKSV